MVSVFGVQKGRRIRSPPASRDPTNELGGNLTLRELPSYCCAMSNNVSDTALEETCIICGRRSPCEELTDEHIIPAALGADLVLHRASCQPCNNTLGSRGEAKLAKGLEWLRWSLGIEDREGDVPSAEHEANVDGVRVRFRVDPNGMAHFHPIFLGEALEGGRIVSRFRFQTQEQALEAEANFRRRRPNGVWEQTKAERTIVEAKAEWPADFLIDPEVLRAVAKMALAYGCLESGRGFAQRKELSDTLQFIRTGQFGDAHPCFLVRDPWLLDRLQIPVGNHVLILIHDGQQRAIFAFVVLLGLYCYYVLLASENAYPDWFTARTFDPLQRTQFKPPNPWFPIPSIKDLVVRKGAESGILRGVADRAVRRYNDFFQPKVLWSPP